MPAGGRSGRKPSADNAATVVLSTVTTTRMGVLGRFASKAHPAALVQSATSSHPSYAGGLQAPPTHE